MGWVNEWVGGFREWVDGRMGGCAKVDNGFFIYIYEVFTWQFFKKTLHYLPLL
jgi:hypothetical protein